MLLAASVVAQKPCNLVTSSQSNTGDILFKTDANCATGATKQVTVGNFISGFGITTGTGTQNYLTKWNNVGGTTIGNSVMYDDGTNVGIGTTSPAQIFDIGGMFQVNSTGNILKINNVATSWPASQGAASTFLQNNGSGTLSWVTAATAGLVSGTGTTNTMAKFTSSTAVGNSLITDNGTTVSVTGTSSIFSVAGTTDATSATTGSMRTAGGLGVAKQAWIGTDLSFASGVNHTISIPTASTGKNLTIKSGDGTNAAGITYILGANSENVEGGDVNIQSGTSATLTGGNVQIDANTGVTANGSIYLGSNIQSPLIKLTGTQLQFVTGTPGVGKVLTDDGSGTGIAVWTTGGTVTSVAQSFTGGLISVSGSPITSSGTLALTVAGTSGGIPYFSSASTWATSSALAANAIVRGGGAGTAPSTDVNFTWDGSKLLAGNAAAVSSGDVANFYRNQNDATFVRVINATTGTLAQSGIVVSADNGSTGGSYVSYNSSYSSSGISVASTVRVSSNTTGGINIGTSSNTQASLWTNNTERVRLQAAGTANIGTKLYISSLSTTPTALIHLGAGTASASSAPIKLTSGTNLTTAETGAIEYNGTNLFFTRTGTTRESVITANAVNSVSPTAPNRTITVVIDGTTYYIHAKTTND